MQYGTHGINQDLLSNQSGGMIHLNHIDNSKDATEDKVHAGSFHTTEITRRDRRHIIKFDVGKLVCTINIINLT